MAKSAVKKSAGEKTKPAAESTPETPNAKRPEPYIVKVEEFATFGARLTLNTGDRLDFIAAGGGSFERNKEIRAELIAAITNTLAAK
jgi:hypothetical protein